MKQLESAAMFIPGRASYVETVADGSFALRLTEASQHRGDVAAEMFHPDFHSAAVFAGGYPGVAQKWPEEHVPPLGGREADLMSVPLQDRLRVAGWTQATIDRRVKRQGVSNNSIGDVAHSIRLGILNPDDFNRDGVIHGIDLVSGALHGIRFRQILSKGLDVDPAYINRVSMRDTYGTPVTQFGPKELAPVAIAKECAAIALTRVVLRDVKPGDVEGLLEAEQRFNDIATRQKH